MRVAPTYGAPTTGAPAADRDSNEDNTVTIESTGAPVRPTPDGLTPAEKAVSAIEETAGGAGLFTLLRDRWRQPEFASFVEMASTTGGAGRRIDFFAVSCWASKGGKGHAIGVEVKASRGDFLRELKNPEKREFAWSVAHECWFAVEKGVVADVSEVPEGWGLLERTAAGLVCKRAAQQRKIEPWPWSFVAAFARRVTDPPPAYTKALYRYAGRELDEDAMVALTKELHASTADDREREAASRAVERYKASRVNEDALVRAVRDRYGWNVKADDLPALLSGGGVSPRDAGSIRSQLAMLTDSIERVLPKVST